MQLHKELGAALQRSSTKKVTATAHRLLLRGAAQQRLVFFSYYAAL
jgi:hypothetical protein